MEVMEGNIAVDTPSPYHINTEVRGDKEAAVNNTVEGGNITQTMRRVTALWTRRRVTALQTRRRATGPQTMRRATAILSMILR